MSKRDWTAARAKVEAEGKCRVCKTTSGLQAAHVVGRKHDPKDGKVRPEDIIPLCLTCHAAYDARGLDILAYLTYEEQAAAVRLVGLERARKRTAPKT